MSQTRKIAVAIGVLFLIQTASYSVGNTLITSGLDAASPDGTRIRIGVLLEFINSVANVAMGVLFLPILRKYSERMALGYTASRIVEAIILLVGVLGALVFIPASQEYLQAGAANASQLQLTATMAAEWHDMAFQIAMISLGAGALLLSAILYQARLVPRVLAVLGFVGYFALFANGWLEIFGRDMGVVLFIPGAIFEFALPVWLIVKGFNESNLTARSATSSKQGAETHEQDEAGNQHGRVVTANSV